MNNRKSLFMFALPLTIAAAFACGDQSAPAIDAAQVEVELAQPQPEVPVCSHCSVTKPTDDDDDDELSMSIDPIYEGEILAAELTTWDDNGSPSYFTLNSSVIADLNDPSTNVTIVYLDTGDSETAQLEWTHTGGTQINVVRVIHE